MKKIFLIEDDFISRRFISIILKDLDVSLINAKNGEEAIDIYKENVNSENYFDIIFLDLMLKKINGFEVLEKINEINNLNNVKNKAKVIITSALGSIDLIEKAFSLGCLDYLIKPILPQKIESIIKDI